jgi:hypothetical protein
MRYSLARTQLSLCLLTRHTLLMRELMVEGLMVEVLAVELFPGSAA